MMNSENQPNTTDAKPEEYKYEKEYGPIHTYADGEIKEYTGKVNKWLLAVYLILMVWAIFYLFKYWGGLGPGLAY